LDYIILFFYKCELVENRSFNYFCNFVNMVSSHKVRLSHNLFYNGIIIDVSFFYLILIYYFVNEYWVWVIYPFIIKLLIFSS